MEAGALQTSLLSVYMDAKLESLEFESYCCLQVLLVYKLLNVS